MSTLVDRLRDDLTAARFTVDALEVLWGAEAAGALHRGQRVPAERALDGSPLATLAALFVLGLPVDAVALDHALPRLGCAGAVELDLISQDGDSVRPRIDLRPYAAVDHAGPMQWWVISDLGELALGHAIPEGHVLGIGGASTTLSGIMITRPAERVLDLGTGCGIQALHASRFAEQIVATDISERAVGLATLNAALNGVETIDFRVGNLFEPVEGERFDRIVSNPPFVITPRSPGMPAYEYRDGGMVGDALVESVVRALPAQLTEGGVAQLLGNWEYREGEDGLARAASWCSGLDYWIVERERMPVEAYAETWIRDGGTRPGAEFDRMYGAWLDDFARRGVTEIGFGYLTLRRSEHPTLARTERIAGGAPAGLGEHLANALDAHDLLHRGGLSDALLTVAPDVTEERHYWPGDEHPAAITLRQGSGFQREVPCGTALAAVVGACDGTLPIGSICAAVADLLEADTASLTAELLPQLEELVFTGFLH